MCEQRFCVSRKTGRSGVHLDASTELMSSCTLKDLGVLTHLRRESPCGVYLARGAECLYLGEFVNDQICPVER
jgi:hypothetical protein